jgi:hypothetical protein
MTAASGSVNTTERDRSAGDLTAHEVRRVLAEYLQAWEVAQLARAAQHLTTAADVIADLKRGQRGYTGRGNYWETTRKGVQVRLHDTTAEAGYRTGLITWRLMRLVIADGTTPDRLAMLNRALRDKKATAARRAAKAIVTAGHALTQLDLLDDLDSLRSIGSNEQAGSGAGGGRS